MIHSYQLNGYNIVLDVNSGGVHVVDDLAYALINAYQAEERDALAARMSARFSISQADVFEAIEEIEELIAEGRLFSKPVSIEMSNVKRESVVKALCLHVAHACNLRCAYCFAGQGQYRGESALMRFEIGKRALDFLIENSGARKNLEVDFFGGEPLLNWDVVKSLVEYARGLEEGAGKRFRFTLTTNGVLIDDEVIDFCNREMDNVVLSLDGRERVNDRMRKTPTGGGSYREIVPKFQKFVEKRGARGYYMRGTFTHANVDFTEDILHMADLGFTQLSMEPVVCAPSQDYALTQADLPVLMEQYERLAVEMAARTDRGEGFTFYHYMLDLEGGPCLSKRAAGCGSGTEYLAVTPGGELYPCHQFVGNPDFLMGNVFDGITNERMRDAFAGAMGSARERCRACWALMYCSGGCAANAYHAEGSIMGVYEYGCELFKKRIECAIMLKAHEAR